MFALGLDYNSVGPEHSHLKFTGRAEYIVADDFECLKGFKMVTEMEGIIPALESSHALWGGMQLAKTLPKDKDVVMSVTFRLNHRTACLRVEGWQLAGRGHFQCVWEMKLTFPVAA